MQNQVKDGPDRGWSWVIAFASFLISLILVGTYRTSGILLVAFVNEYGESREESSWPLFVCYSLVDMSGIIVGPLGQHFGIRPIVIVGALVSTAGVSLCYFARSLTFLTLSYGVIFGIGFGLTYHLMQVLINQYFLKYRTTVSGVANSGACFGSVILPLLFEHLIFSYGLNGSMLLVGGLILQLTISGALMKPPSWLKTIIDNAAINNNPSETSNDLKNIKYSSLKMDDFLHNCDYREDSTMNQDAENTKDKTTNLPMSNDGSQNTCGKRLPLNNLECIISSDRNYTNSNGYNKDTDENINQLSFLCKDNFKKRNVMNAFKEEMCTPDENVQERMNYNFISFRESIDENVEEISELEEKNRLIPMSYNVQVVKQNQDNVFKRFLGFPADNTDQTNSVIKVGSVPLTKVNKNNTVLNSGKENDYSNKTSSFNLRTLQPQFDNDSKVPKNEVRIYEQGSDSQNTNTKWSILRSYRHILTCPMFYVLALSNTLFFCKEGMFYVINVDFYMDKGVAETDTKYIIFAFSISDLVGRMFFGWVTDRKYLRKSHFMMICMAIVGIVFFIFPFATGYASLIILNTIYGVIQGCTTIVSLVIPADYLDRQTQAIAYGCIAFLNGLVMLSFSFLVGHFRDNLGSYSSIFYIMGGISLGASSLWLLENCVVKRKNATEIGPPV